MHAFFNFILNEKSTRIFIAALPNIKSLTKLSKILLVFDNKKTSPEDRYQIFGSIGSRNLHGGIIDVFITIIKEHSNLLAEAIKGSCPGAPSDVEERLKTLCLCYEKSDYRKAGFKTRFPLHSKDL